MTTQEVIETANRIAEATKSQREDIGTGGMGMKLKYQNEVIQGQRYQGGPTNEALYIDIIQYLTDNHSLEFEDFTIDYGMID